jgi:hypothetical protein
VKNPCIQLEVVKTLNPVTLLLVDLSLLEHECLEVKNKVFSSRPDLPDQLISHLYFDYFTDGSSFAWDSMCFARNVMVTLDSVIEAHPLPVGTSAQRPNSPSSLRHSSSLQE